MSSAPLLSVVMPVHNGERHLPEAMRSVIDLALPSFEIVLVDDGSTDGTLTAAKGFGDIVRIVSQPHGGPAAARNRGLALAQGEIVGLLDADDRWTPAVAQVLLPHLVADDGLDLVRGRIQEFRGTAAAVELFGAPYDYLNLGSALYRRRVFDTVGLFDESLRLCEDYDWVLRAFEARVRAQRVSDTALLYRRHGESLTHGRSAHEIDMARAHKKAMDRRRRRPEIARVPPGYPSLVEFVGQGPAAARVPPSERSAGPGDAPATEVRGARQPLSRCDDRRIAPATDEVLGFAVVRNESLRLPYCLEYHRRVGVSRFFVVDNDSDDGTYEWLMGQPDVHVWRTSASFGAARCGTDWIEQLLRDHGHGHWCLVIDADELLVYPGVEATPLPDYCAGLERAGRRAAMGIMIDMYADRPVQDAHLEAGQPFTDVCRYFDRRVFHDRVERFHQHDEHPSVFGGVRRRVFGGCEPGKDERFFYCLSKVPLLRYDPSLVLADNLHWTSCREVAVQAVGLLHFKFFADFHANAVREAARQEHWHAALQYERYADVSGANAGLKLYDPELSVRYEDSRQLQHLDLLRSIGPQVVVAAGSRPKEDPVSGDQTRMLHQVRGLIRSRRAGEYNAQAEGMELLKQHRWQDAASAFEAAIRQTPEFSWSHHYLGDVLAVLGRWEDADAAYARAIALNPYFAPSHFNRGEVHARTEQWELAIDCYRRAIDLQSDLPNAARALARALARRARQLEQEAQTWYRRALAADPSDPAIYAEVAELRPPDPDLCLQLADALAGSQQRIKAIFFYQLAIQIRPDDAAAHARLAKVLRQDGDLPGAVASCRRAVLLAGGHAEYHAQLAVLLAEQGQIEEAIAAQERGIALEPGRPAWLKDLGDLLARAGRLDEAATAYAQAAAHGYEPY